MKRVALLAVLAGLTAAAPVQAQDMTAAREACLADYGKHCSTVVPGGGRIVQCLSQNLHKLTPACRAAVTEAVAAKAQTK